MSFIGFPPRPHFRDNFSPSTRPFRKPKAAFGCLCRRNGPETGFWHMNDAATMAHGQMTGEVTGAVKTLLRLEGLALFAAMVALYALWGGSWWTFAILFLLPDLSFAAYLAGPGTGALAYNAAHSTVLPVALMALGYVLPEPLIRSIAVIWLAHIGIDRAVGYGLKYQAGFAFTHLGRLGKKMPL
jgi:hypothetical protein